MKMRAPKKNGILRDRALWVTAARSIGISLLAALVMLYAALEVKIAAQRQVKQSLDGALAAYSSAPVKSFEQKAADYQQRLNAVSQALAEHTAPSRIFAFLQASTLSDVWFSAFDLAPAANSLRLTGNAGSVQALSDQVSAFRQDTQSVSNAALTSFQALPDGSVNFVITVSLNPQLLKY